jgi:hypothetical protein
MQCHQYGVESRHPIEFSRQDGAPLELVGGFQIVAALDDVPAAMATSTSYGAFRPGFAPSRRQLSLAADLYPSQLLAVAVGLNWFRTCR